MTKTDEVRRVAATLPRGLYFDQAGEPWTHSPDGGWFDRHSVRHGAEVLLNLVLRIHTPLNLQRVDAVTT